MNCTVYLAAGDNLTNQFSEFKGVTRVMREGEVLAVTVAQECECDDAVTGCGQAEWTALTRLTSSEEAEYCYKDIGDEAGTDICIAYSVGSSPNRFCSLVPKPEYDLYWHETKFGADQDIAHTISGLYGNSRLGCGIHATCVHEVGGYTPAYNYLCDEDASVNETMPFELIRQAMEQRFEQGLNAKNCTEPTECPHPESNSTSFKWDAWKYSTIGLGAATLAFGTVAAVFVVKSVHKCIRSRNEIQIELIDDPALTHTLLQNQQN